ncbi:hypothetical protein IWW50_006872, partial [Coemansia erecta]
MEVTEETQWVEHDGREFYTHEYRAAKAVATVLIVHGLGEHIDRYDGLARALAQAGIRVLGFDQRGFGKTGRRCGRLGDNEGLARVCADIAFMSQRVAIAGVPHFLFGHSMGGLNVLNYALEHNRDGHVRGVIASAPALLPGRPLMPPAFVVGLLHQVARVVPSIQKSTGINVDMLTSNEDERSRFGASVENIGHCTLGTLSSILRRGPQVIADAPRFDTPVLLVHAAGDKATDFAGTARFFAALPDGLDKQYKEFDC